jgi:hypothetical protein
MPYKAGMWGVPGAVLAAPMLAIAKIICDRIRSLAAFGRFWKDSRLALASIEPRDGWVHGPDYFCLE